MPDANEFVKTIKKAATDAVEAGNPVNVCFGKVTRVKPIEILVEQKLRLGEAQLVLSLNVTDHMTEATVQWESGSHKIKHRHRESTGSSTEYTETPHTHGIEGRKNFMLHNGLEVDDEVILLRQQGGQKYIVIDRVGEMG